MDERLKELTQRANGVYLQIARFKSTKVAGDLFKMFRTVEQKLTEISKESVNCKRKQRPTLQYEELLSECTEHLETLEKYIVFARLISG